LADARDQSVTFDVLSLRSVPSHNGFEETDNRVRTRPGTV
jgi:hypothetical protein